MVVMAVTTGTATVVPNQPLILDPTLRVIPRVALVRLESLRLGQPLVVILSLQVLHLLQAAAV